MAGVNTLVVRQSPTGNVAEGLGFAIPINTVQAVAQQIIEQGYFARPYMGVSFQPISPEIAARYDLPAKWGAFITKVEPGSPASEAGIQKGDIITKVGEIAIDESHSYVNSLFSYQPGDQIPLTVVRDGKEVQLQITLGEASRR